MITIGSHKIFSLQEANDLLPVIERIVKEAMNRLEKLQSLHNYLTKSYKAEAAKQCIAESGDVHVVKERKLRQLGVSVHNMWTVHIDNGFGVWCWELGENAITHYHDYNENVRRKIEPRLAD